MALMNRIDRLLFDRRAAGRGLRCHSRDASCRCTPTGAGTTSDRPVGRRSGAARPHPHRLARSQSTRAASSQSGPSAQPGSSSPFAFHGHTIVPGFIDVHVHGVSGIDTLGQGDAVATHRPGASEIRRHRILPNDRGLLACRPPAVCSNRCGTPRTARTGGAACCLLISKATSSSRLSRRTASRLPAHACGVRGAAARRRTHRGRRHSPRSELLGGDRGGAPDIAIVTVAPEIEAGLELIAWLSQLGVRVSLGHSGATFDQALAAIAAGARRRRISSIACRRSIIALPGLAARSCRATRWRPN